VFSSDGEIVHREGLTKVSGLYALGLRFQRTRKSHFIGGVGEDAEFLAARIVAEEPARTRERLRRMRALVRSACTWEAGWCGSATGHSLGHSGA
jgi:hypothetical protein